MLCAFSSLASASSYLPCLANVKPMLLRVRPTDADLSPLLLRKVSRLSSCIAKASSYLPIEEYSSPRKKET
jgi:hypothetical protein